MTTGSVTSAITRNRPPQCGQSVISNSKTRFNRWAQVSGAMGRSLAGPGCGQPDRPPFRPHLAANCGPAVTVNNRGNASTGY